MRPNDMLVLSDLHSGAIGGLTRPVNWTSGLPQQDGEKDSLHARRKFVRAVQQAEWNWARQRLLNLRPKVLVLNGDLTDGKQKKSEGAGLWSAVPKEQADAVVEIIRPFREAHVKIFIVRGTRYHDENGVEDYIADELGAEISDHGFLDVGGVVFDIKHKESGGDTPAGRPSLRNSMLSNLLWAARDMQPAADVTLRSHLHSYYFEGSDNWLGLVTPGLQWLSSYGQLEVKRPIQVGAVYFNRIVKGDVQWQGLIAKLPELKAHVWKI